jgi:hypothetical protein
MKLYKFTRTMKYFIDEKVFEYNYKMLPRGKRTMAASFGQDRSQKATFQSNVFYKAHMHRFMYPHTYTKTYIQR